MATLEVSLWLWPTLENSFTLEKKGREIGNESEGRYREKFGRGVGGEKRYKPNYLQPLDQIGELGRERSERTLLDYFHYYNCNIMGKRESRTCSLFSLNKDEKGMWGIPYWEAGGKILIRNSKVRFKIVFNPKNQFFTSIDVTRNSSPSFTVLELIGR